MSEGDRFKVEFELAMAKLDNYRMRASRAVKDVIHENKFSKLVSDEQRELASAQAEAFAGETMNFFEENLTAKLKPIAPNKEQVKLFQFLLESIGNKNLVLEKTKGIVLDGSNGERAAITKKYVASDRKDDTGIIEDTLFNLYQKKHVVLHVVWGVDTDFPNKISIFGFVGTKDPSMHFLTFPEKIENPEQAQKYLQQREVVNGFTSKIGVYGKGKRIVLNSEGKYQGKDVSTTEQFFLIGSFEGEGTERTYWIYGSNNDKKNRMTIKEGSSVKDLASETTKD